MQNSPKILAALTYPLASLARLVNVFLRRDRLLLKDVSNGNSLWIKRHKQPDTASYFSERSCAEGGVGASAARPVTLLLRGVARLYTPPRKVAKGIYKASAEREQGI